MSTKMYLYTAVVPMILWLLNSLNINHLFKKSRILEARIFMVIVTFILSYLFVNFLYDIAQE